VIALSRPYSCVMGGPVLNAVDPAIFTLRYFTHCLECGFAAMPAAIMAWTSTSATSRG
jgi:hypothetical protein